jgi:hypothetical protein
LLLGTLTFESLQEAPVSLEATGEVACGEAFRWPGKEYYARQYAFCLEFLQRKGLPPDVSGFREKGLMDVIEDLDRAGRETIRRAELLEVAHQNNHIAMIKEAVLKDTKSALVRHTYPRRSGRRKGGARAR